MAQGTVTYYQEIGRTVFDWDIENFDQNIEVFVSPSFNIRATATPEVETSTRLERFHLELQNLVGGRFDISIVKQSPGEVMTLINFVRDDSAIKGIQDPIGFTLGEMQKGLIDELVYPDVLPNNTRITVEIVLNQVVIETSHVPPF